MGTICPKGVDHRSHLTHGSLLWHRSHPCHGSHHHLRLRRHGHSSKCRIRLLLTLLPWRFQPSDGLPNQCLGLGLWFGWVFGGRRQEQIWFMGTICPKGVDVCPIVAIWPMEVSCDIGVSLVLEAIIIWGWGGMVIAASPEFSFSLFTFLGDSSPVMALWTSALDLGFDLAGFLVAGGRSRFGIFPYSRNYCCCCSTRALVICTVKVDFIWVEGVLKQSFYPLSIINSEKKYEDLIIVLNINNNWITLLWKCFFARLWLFD